MVHSYRGFLVAWGLNIWPNLCCSNEFGSGAFCWCSSKESTEKGMGIGSWTWDSLLPHLFWLLLIPSLPKHSFIPPTAHPHNQPIWTGARGLLCWSAWLDASHSHWSPCNAHHAAAFPPAAWHFCWQNTCSAGSSISWDWAVILITASAACPHTTSIRGKCRG